MVKRIARFIGYSIGILSIIIFIIGLIITNNKYQKKKNLEETYNRLIEPMSEYLEDKYIEKMVIKDEISSGRDSGTTLYASPENNNEIEFRVHDLGAEIDFRYGGWNNWQFWDDYLERYAEWEAVSIINPIIEKYCNDFYCRTTLSYRWEDTGILRDYYMANKRHLSWHDEDHFDELERATVGLYDYDISTVEQNIIIPILSDLLELDFVINTFIFDLYTNRIGEHISIWYNYEDGVFQLSHAFDAYGRRLERKIESFSDLAIYLN